jgi:probable rRNA maturation factor
VAKTEHIRGKHYVSFILVSDEDIQVINTTYRHIERPTDVITFANIDSSPEGIIPDELGDIFISIDRTLSQAKEYEHSIEREFSFLATHGMLHILGYDHMDPADEEVMIAKQKNIMKIIHL